MKSLPRQSRSRSGEIFTVCKSILVSTVTFKTNLDFSHTSYEIVQASNTLQHNTLHFCCLYCLPPNPRNNLTESMFTEQLPDLLDYINNVPGFVCLVCDMNIHFDNPLQSLTKHTLTTLRLNSLVKVINNPTHMTAHMSGIMTGLLIDLTMTSMKNLLLQTNLYRTIIALSPTSMFQSHSLLPYKGLLGTCLTQTVHHLLLNFPVFQSFNLFKRRTSAVNLWHCTR